jgi:beta-mannosidase
MNTMTSIIDGFHMTTGLLRELLKVWLYKYNSYHIHLVLISKTVDASLLSKESVHLVAKGIDTVSSVYINDKLIGTTDNMFVRYKFDIKQFLKTGQNKIAVTFESAVHYGKRQSESYQKSFSYPIPPGIQLIS